MTTAGVAHALLAGGASLDLIRVFRRAKDLEHMIRDKSWRDLWALVEAMRGNRSPVKTLVLVSGDVHHSYCMTGNVSGDGRPFPEVLQITSSGLQTTIRRGMQEALGEALSDLSFGFAQRHLVPGFMSKPGSRRRELALYRNAVAVVDVSLGAHVDVRVLHLAGDDDTKGVDPYVYQYTSGPSYLNMGEPANTPYRLGTPGKTSEGVSEDRIERAVSDEAAMEAPEDEPNSREDGSPGPEPPIGDDDVSAAAWLADDRGGWGRDESAPDDSIGSAERALTETIPATIGVEFELRPDPETNGLTQLLADAPEADGTLSEDRQNPPLPERCDRVQVSVPASGDDAARFPEFERQVTRWVATCVSSGREAELVRRNPSLRRVWDTAKDRRGETVSVEARYQFTPVAGGVRAQSVTFSTPLPAPPERTPPTREPAPAPAPGPAPAPPDAPATSGTLVIDRPASDVDNDIVLIIVALQKPGDVAQYWADEVRPNRTRWAHPLSELEQSYIDSLTDSVVPAPLRMRAPVDPGRMTAEETDAARRLFGAGGDAARRYANYENRRRVLAHYVYTHPATVRLQLGLYRLVRDVNPLHFALERGWQICGGREMFTEQEVSRLGAAFDFVTALALVYGVGKALQITRPAGAAPRAAPRSLTDPIYDLPADGGGMRINARWYSEHALERMAPDTLEVRAQLRTRVGQRLERLGITSGHPAYGRVLARALQRIDPRGVPPSVVEAEILRPGSTNVRVVTARRGGVVVTVIRR